MKTHIQFVQQLFKVKEENLFNPYHDICDKYDKPRAATIRFCLLADILDEARSQEIDSIWVGQEYSHRGGRRTGLAFTDEHHLHDHCVRFGPEPIRATEGEPSKEVSSTIVFQMLNQIKLPIFLWNLWPFHTHYFYNEFTNAPCSPQQQAHGRKILADLIEILKPKRIVPIGKIAADNIYCMQVLHGVDELVRRDNIFPVRHPAHGGANEFRQQIAEIYNLPKKPESRQLSF